MAPRGPPWLLFPEMPSQRWEEGVVFAQTTQAEVYRKRGLLCSQVLEGVLKDE